MVAFNKRFQYFSRFRPPWHVRAGTRDCNWSEYITYLNSAPFVWNQMKLVLKYVRLLHPVFDYVQLFKCSICKILGWVRVNWFDYRTQSKSIKRLQVDWVRLPNVWLSTPGIVYVTSSNPGGLKLFFFVAHYFFFLIICFVLFVFLSYFSLCYVSLFLIAPRGFCNNVFLVWFARC